MKQIKNSIPVIRSRWPAIVSALYLTIVGASASVIFQAGFNGSGGGTGGTNDMIVFGGTGAIVADGINEAAVVTNSNPFIGTSNYLHVATLSSSGGGLYTPVQFTFASATNSPVAWQGTNVPNPTPPGDGTYTNFTALHGAYDGFFRVNGSTSGGVHDINGVRPFDQSFGISGGNGLTMTMWGQGGGNLVLQLKVNNYQNTNPPAIINFNLTTGSGGYDGLSVITMYGGFLLNQGQIYHVGFTLNTDANGLTTAKFFVTLGTGAIDTTSDAVAVATFNLDAASVGTAFQNNVWRLTGWGSGETNNVDYSVASLYDSVPNSFAALPGTITLPPGSVVTLTASDPGYGALCSFNTGLNWSSGLKPTSIYNYVVTNGLQLLTPNVFNGNYTFAGNSLTITGGGNMSEGGGHANTIIVPNLILDNGNLGMIGQSVGSTMTLGGNITLGPGGGTDQIDWDTTGSENIMNIIAPIGGVGAFHVVNISPTATVPTPQPFLLATNTYSGGTTVGTNSLLTVGSDGGLGSGDVTLTSPGAALTLQGGTLNNYIASTGRLILPVGLTDSAVNLNYSGVDTIANLSFDGGATFQPAGTYGAIGSGATYENAAFSGSGLLNVLGTTPPPGFLPPIVSSGQITLSWTNSGVLLWSTNVLGPWITNTSATASPYSESIVHNQNRFYRLQAH